MNLNCANYARNVRAIKGRSWTSGSESNVLAFLEQVYSTSRNCPILRPRHRRMPSWIGHCRVMITFQDVPLMQKCGLGSLKHVLIDRHRVHQNVDRVLSQALDIIINHRTPSAAILKLTVFELICI